MTKHTMNINTSILTVSDRCAAGSAEDASGPALARFMSEDFAAQILSTAIVPDDIDTIRATLRTWLETRPVPDLILTTGGTGLAPRDRTPEAVRALLDIEHPGLLERARAVCGAQHPKAYLSRGIAGVAQSTLIITLPGSPKGAVETLSAIADLLPHAIQHVSGSGDPHAAHPRGASDL